MKKYILLFIGLFILTITMPSYAFTPVSCTKAHNDLSALFYSYDDIVQATRNQEKSHFLVLFNPDQPEFFTELHDLAEKWVTSHYGCSTNILLLCPTGINILIYPPQPDPMLAKIKTFQTKFADANLPTSGNWLIVIEMTVDREFVYDIHELTLPLSTIHHQCDEAE